MKKAAAFILTICMVIMAVAPVSIKAAADNMFYITYQANIGNQNLIDMGYVQPNPNGSISLFMTDNQIDVYNSLTLPVDLSDWDYYILTGSNTWQGENFSSVANGTLVVYNSENPIIMYNGNSQLRNLYSATSSYQNGTYTWVTANQISFYDSDLKQKQLDGDFKIYDIQNGSFTERSNYAFYQDVSIGVTGTYICSTNQPVYYYGGDICANSTATVTNYYNQNEVVAWFIDGVEKSENVLPKFKVTDGETILDYDDSIGGGVPDLQQDNSLSLSSIDMIPLKDNFVGGMTAAKVTGAFDFNTFDTTFGGDQVKAAAAVSNYGLQFDVSVNYRVDTSYDKALFQSLFGQSYSGSIHSSFYVDGITQSDAQILDVPITLSDLLENSDTIVTGDKRGMALLALINYAQEGERGSKTADFLGFGGLTLEDDAIVSEVIGSVPLLGGLTNEIRDWIAADYVYGLTELNYTAFVTPFNDGVNIKGVPSKTECDMISGVHTGTAGGGIKTDPVTGDVTVNPDFTIGPHQNYLLPTVLPSGGTGEIVVTGSPSNSSATGGAGGNSNVNVNANPVINVQNGFDEFAKVMKLSENSNKIQKSYWGAFGYFRDNPATDLYKDYFGWLPEEFVTFIITCCTVTFGIGVFRFIRGRSL